MRGVLTVQENEPHMSTYFERAQPQQTTQTTGSGRVRSDPGIESRADLLFKDQDGEDVTSTSG
jgi:hypothetical protein